MWSEDDVMGRKVTSASEVVAFSPMTLSLQLFSTLSLIGNNDNKIICG
jgi:hypothetical protein